MDAQRDESRDATGIIATRCFRNTTGSDVAATIFRPTMISPDEWECEFRISGLPENATDRGRGEDSMAALIDALQGVRAYLDRAGVALTWGDGEVGELGIPRPIPNGYGVQMEKHLRDMVNEEVARLAKAKHKSKGDP
jgi:hypothetical protein